MDPIDEIDEKVGRLRELMRALGLDGVLLQRVSSFAWVTAGAASYVNVAATFGPSQILVRADGARCVLTNVIEAPRLEVEEGLVAAGFEPHAAPWHAASVVPPGLVEGLRLGSDGPFPGAADLSAELARLRSRLRPPEIARLREVGRACAAAMDAAARSVRAGDSEHALAGRLAAEALARGAQPLVTLVAADDRAYAYRHPLPAGARLRGHVLLVLTARRRGLCCSISRLVALGRAPEELRRRTEAVAAVDAALIAASRPGRSLGDALAAGLEAYAAVGHAEEWRRHHQGGLTGYEPREILARPASDVPLAAGHAIAWNPTIAGTKMEDTILVTDSGPEVLTAIEGWPALPAGGLERPGILELGETAV
jgi:antitoxin VapB